MAVHRAPQTSGRAGKWLLIGVPPVVLLGGAALLFIAEPQEPSAPLDADLCPLDADPARAVLLLDLRKPLGGQAATLATNALRDVTLDLAANTELAVFALTPNPGTPRLPIRRFCKPYGNDAISPTSAKDGGVPVRDCDDLPAQLAAQTRANATRFCALRDDVAAHIERLAARPLAVPVPNAYLIEALEETSLAYAERAGAKSLYVFSDMLQHAGWFSHIERGSQGWGFNDFIHMREMEVASVGPRPPPLEDVAVTIFYVPREGVTDAPRAKMNHTEFWRRYFADAMGAEPRFNERAPMPSYAVDPLLNKLSQAEELAQERKRLEAESKRLERATAEYQAAQQRARDAASRAQAAERAARERALAAAATPPEAEPSAPPREVAPVDESEATPPPEADAPADTGTPADEAPAQVAAIVPAEPPPEEAAVLPAEEPAPAVPAPVEVEPPPPPAPADLAATPGPEPGSAQGAQQDASDNAACEAVLQPRFRNTNAYPIKSRRLNLGSADIAVEFAVNEQGETLDDSVQVIVDASIASRPTYFDAFADEARKLVRDWVFDFNASAAPCERRQTLRARVEFKY